MPKQTGKSKTVKKKSVKKKKEEDPCVICFSKKINKASIDCCSHTFCRKCIVKWSETENSCPHCRKKFHQVKTRNTKRRIEDKRQRPDNITEEVYNEMRDNWAALFSRAILNFIRSDEYKLQLTSMFVRHEDPFVDRVYRMINNYLNDDSFIEEYIGVTPENLRDTARADIQIAKDCMRAVFEREPGGSSDNPISI